MDEGQLLNGKGSSLALVQQMKHPKSTTKYMFREIELIQTSAGQ